MKSTIAFKPKPSKTADEKSDCKNREVAVGMHIIYRLHEKEETPSKPKISDKK